MLPTARGSGDAKMVKRGETVMVSATTSLGGMGDTVWASHAPMGQQLLWEVEAQVTPPGGPKITQLSRKPTRLMQPFQVLACTGLVTRAAGSISGSYCLLDYQP